MLNYRYTYIIIDENYILKLLKIEDKLNKIKQINLKSV